MNKNTFSFLAFFCALILYSQDKTIELPLIGDRLSGAVSETEEEILGRQFLRDLKRETDIYMTLLFRSGLNFLFIRLVKTAK